MARAMAGWGRDGSGIERDGEVGLGQLLLHNTPESLAESLPRRSARDDGLVITAGARLDNREELFGALDVEPGERATMPDSTLVLRAYRRWGTECADRLLGDWSFAIWDRRRRRLSLARDHHGLTGLYYVSTPRLFAFASSIKALLALPEVPCRPNLRRVAHVLAAWREEGAPTCYEGIRRLPPAHAMAVTPERAVVERYWYLEDTPRLELGSDQEYLEAFLELYAEAVRCRLRSHRAVGVMLSGGLDSSSVAALAARQLGGDGRGLAAFTSVPIHDSSGTTGRGRFGDERPFVEATARWVGNLDLHWITAAEVSPIAAMRKGLELHAEPGHAAANYFWILDLLGSARERGVATLLTGQGGNFTVSWPGWNRPLVPHVRPGLAAALARQLTEGQGRGPRALWKVVRRHLVRPRLPPAWARALRYRRAGRKHWLGSSALNPDLARSLELDRHPSLVPLTDPREARFALLGPGRATTGSIWHELGAGYGLEIRDPTLDKRLMAFCLSLPNRQYARRGDRRPAAPRLRGSSAADGPLEPGERPAGSRSGSQVPRPSPGARGDARAAGTVRAGGADAGPGQAEAGLRNPAEGNRRRRHPPGRGGPGERAHGRDLPADRRGPAEEGLRIRSLRPEHHCVGGAHPAGPGVTNVENASRGRIPLQLGLLGSRRLMLGRGY